MRKVQKGKTDTRKREKKGIVSGAKRSPVLAGAQRHGARIERKKVKK